MVDVLFQDRKDAAEQLAEKLAQWVTTNRTTGEQQNPDFLVILAIPRGGAAIKL